MLHISKTLSTCGIALVMVLVGVTSAFKDAPKDPQNTFWVLKSGAQVGSTDPADYEIGTSGCDAQIHFCGFEAPPDQTTPTEPDIEAVLNLTEDLQYLENHLNDHVDDSQAMFYKDAN